MKKNILKIASLAVLITIIVGSYLPIWNGKRERQEEIEEYLYVDKGYN